jgi:hypothetical protein
VCVCLCVSVWVVAESSALSVSFRAFYLERSNLPTDAGATAVKIDQVCLLLEVWAGWGHLQAESTLIRPRGPLQPPSACFFWVTGSCWPLLLGAF